MSAIAMYQQLSAMARIGNISHMNARIQGAILSTVGARWTKVATVIAKVAHALGQDLPAGDEGHKAISTEIEALIQEGRLVAQGNIKNWRFSEVRKAGLLEESHYFSN